MTYDELSDDKKAELALLNLEHIARCRTAIAAMQVRDIANPSPGYGDEVTREELAAWWGRAEKERMEEEVRIRKDSKHYFDARRKIYGA